MALQRALRNTLTTPTLLAVCGVLVACSLTVASLAASLVNGLLVRVGVKEGMGTPAAANT